MRALFRTFLRFRWKLLFAATLASVATTVAVMVVVISMYWLSQRAHLQTDHLPREVLAELDVLARQLGPHVRRDPPDAAAIEAWIDGYHSERPFRLRLAADACDDLRWNSSVKVERFAVVDATGRVLAGRTPDADDAVDDSEAPPPGQRLSELLPPAGLAVLQAATDGVTERTQLAQRRDLGNTFAARPIVADDGRVQGAIYVEAKTQPPTHGQVLLAVLKEVPSNLGEILPFCLALGVVFSLVTSWGLLRRLRRLGEAATAWSGGDFSFRVRDTSGDELGELGRNLDHMADQLGGLLETRQALAGLEERNHLARELHDTVKQELFSVTLLLGTVSELTGKDDAAAARHLAEARQLAQKAGRELNALILQLRPAALDGKGLAGALREYCEAWSRQIGIESQVRVQGERPLPLEVEQGLFRVAQEALANVAWHSGAASVDVHLAIDPSRTPVAGNGKDHGIEQSPGSMVLTIRDRGQGFDATHAGGGGYGLRSMRERVEHLKGSFRIESTPGAGTRVVAECPLPPVA